MPTSGSAEGEVCVGAGNEVAGDVSESLVAIAGVLAQRSEGLVHVEAATLGELAFGLLDDDPAIEGCLELLGAGLAAVHVPLMEQPDGGDVGECLPMRSSAGSNGRGEPGTGSARQ